MQGFGSQYGSTLATSQRDTFGGIFGIGGIDNDPGWAFRSVAGKCAMATSKVTKWKAELAEAKRKGKDTSREQENLSFWTKRKTDFCSQQSYDPLAEMAESTAPIIPLAPDAGQQPAPSASLTSSASGLLPLVLVGALGIAVVGGVVWYAKGRRGRKAKASAAAAVAA